MQQEPLTTGSGRSHSISQAQPRALAVTELNKRRKGPPAFWRAFFFSYGAAGVLCRLFFLRHASSCSFQNIAHLFRGEAFVFCICNAEPRQFRSIHSWQSTRRCYCGQAAPPSIQIFSWATVSGRVSGGSVRPSPGFHPHPTRSSFPM